MTKLYLAHKSSSYLKIDWYRLKLCLFYMLLILLKRQTSCPGIFIPWKWRWYKARILNTQGIFKHLIISCHEHSIVWNKFHSQSKSQGVETYTSSVEEAVTLPGNRFWYRDVGGMWEVRNCTVNNISHIMIQSCLLYFVNAMRKFKITYPVGIIFLFDSAD